MQTVVIKADKRGKTPILDSTDSLRHKEIPKDMPWPDDIVNKGDEDQVEIIQDKETWDKN